MKKPLNRKPVRVWLGFMISLAPVVVFGAAPFGVPVGGPPDVVGLDTGLMILWSTVFAAFNLLFWSWFR